MVEFPFKEFLATRSNQGIAGYSWFRDRQRDTMRRYIPVMIATVLMTALSVGCAGNPAAPTTTQSVNSPGPMVLQPQAEPEIRTGDSDKFLGEFQIIEKDGELTIIQTREGASDVDATKYLSTTNPLAPLFLCVKAIKWMDDPSEADPKQGTWQFLMSFSNNTNALIYDPWLIFTDLGQKTYTNPTGITSRAYGYLSKPYAGFGGTDGYINPHSRVSVSADVFFPKTQPTLYPIKFVAYGSFPEDYIEIGEGGGDMSSWRDAYDAAGGRNVVGSATEVVSPLGSGLRQRLTAGLLIHNPGVGTCFCLPGDFADAFWSVPQPEFNLGLPTGPIGDHGPAYYGSYFQLMPFDGQSAAIYKITSGQNAGKVTPVPKDFNSAWISVGAWWGEYGLPDSYGFGCGPSYYGTGFDMVGFEYGSIYKHTTGSHAPNLYPVRGDFDNKWASYGGWWDIMGLPYAEMGAGSSSHGTAFEELGFECGGSIYKHTSGGHSGWLYVIMGSIHNCWVSNGAWWGSLGLPVTDSYVWSEGGYAQDFESCYIHPPGDCYVDCSGGEDKVQFPLSDYAPMSQDWGVYNSSWQGYHMAEDVLAGEGTTVYAAAEGTVKRAGDATGYGHVIVLEHSAAQTGCYTPVCSLYGHLKHPNLYEGQLVSKGKPIGYIGNSSENGGWVTHLHFAIFWGSYVIPWIYRGYDPPGTLSDSTDPTDFVNSY